MKEGLNTSGIDRFYKGQAEILKHIITWSNDMYRISLEKDTEEKIIKMENHYKKL